MTDDELLDKMHEAYHQAWDKADRRRNVTRQVMWPLLALVREHDAAQLAAARAEGHAAGRLEGELSGLSQGFAVASAYGKRWLAQRYKDVQARIAALAIPSPEGAK